MCARSLGEGGVSKMLAIACRGGSFTQWVRTQRVIKNGWKFHQNYKFLKGNEGTNWNEGVYCGFQSLQAIYYWPDTIAAPVSKFGTKLCILNFLPSLPQFDTNVMQFNCQSCAKSRELMCLGCQQSFKSMDVDCKAVSYCSSVRDLQPLQE